jgi:O-antigen/teichoic acid export membrane protein
MLTVKTILGAGWTVSSRLSGRLIDFVTVLILARTLTPADFGLMALAMSVTLIVDAVLQIPLILALTRLPSVSKSHLDTAFTLGLLRGLAMAIVVLIAAWPFAHIYDDHRLISLIAVLAIGPIARSLYSPAMVKYVRELNFRLIFIAEMSGKIGASLLAVAIVYVGGGYWAIAASSITTPIAITVISYFIAPYRPAFSMASFPEFSSFIGWFSMSQVTSTISWQFDRIMLGYFISKSDLGQFAMATDLSDLPTQSLIGPAMQPLMAAFSSISNDRERLSKAYLRASRFTMLLAAPACIGMSLTADLIVSVLLGAKWQEAAFYLHWLSLTIVLNAFYQPVGSLAMATNRNNMIFRINLVELLSRVTLVSLGIYFYSLIGVVFARGAMSLILFVVALLTVKHLAGIRVSTQAQNLWQVAAACVAMAAAVVLLRHELNGSGMYALIELILTGATGAAIYAAALFALGLRIRDLSRTN